MKLTPEAAAALERLRNGDMSQHVGDCIRMIRELGRLLFPKGHDEEITPERLIACGLTELTSPVSAWRRFIFDGRNGIVVEINPLMVACWGTDRYQFPTAYVPHTMGEVWNIMERCGLEVKHGIE